MQCKQAHEYAPIKCNQSKFMSLLPLFCVLLLSKNFDPSLFFNVAPSLSMSISNLYLFVSISPKAFISYLSLSLPLVQSQSQGFHIFVPLCPCPCPTSTSLSPSLPKLSYLISPYLSPLYNLNLKAFVSLYNLSPFVIHFHKR